MLYRFHKKPFLAERREGHLQHIKNIPKLDFPLSNVLVHIIHAENDY